MCRPKALLLVLAFAGFCFAREPECLCPVSPPCGSGCEFDGFEGCQCSGGGGSCAPNAFGIYPDCECNPGYFGDGTNYCFVCQENCGSGSYRSGCSGSNAGTCQPCGACLDGDYRTGCGGLSGGYCEDCTICKINEYETSSCTSSSDRQCALCRSCSANEYVAAPCGGTSNTVCATCSTCSTLQFMTSDCTGTEDRQCQDCKTCTSTEYQTAPCSSTADRQCSACLTNCGSGRYRSGCGGSSAGSCTDCGSCAAGQYRTGCGGLSAGSCLACQSNCGAGRYRSGCSGTSSGSCQDCGTCSSGSYRSGCGGLSGGTCTACPTCASGSYRAGCTGSSSGTCQTCSCGSDQYISGGCSGVSPPTCSACRTCGTGFFETSPCTLTSNRECTACGSCSPGFRRSGCSGTSAGTCVPNSCTSPPGNPANGDVSFSSGNDYDSVATFTCDVGYYNSGTLSVTCDAATADKPWPSSSPSCTRTQCSPNPSAASGGSVSYSDGSFHASVATFSCPVGYARGGTPSITCNAPNANGAWPTPSSTPTCSQTSCTNSPVAPTYGSVTKTNFDRHGSVASFSCVAGRKCVSCSSVTCSAPSSNQEWPAASPSCQRTVCASAPTAPTNGGVAFSDGNYHGSVASFSCDTGFRRTGSSSVTCSAVSSDDTWPTPPSAPTCSATTCSNPPSAPVNGAVSFSAGNAHDSVATFSCNEGYIVSGATTVRCNAPSDNDDWPTSSTTCIDSGCTGAPTPHPQGSVSFSDGSTHMSVATFSCNTGYKNTGTSSVQCNAPSGSQPWPASSPSCTATVCSARPGPPTHGTVSFPSGDGHGAPAVFSCNTGYTLVGPSIVCSAPSNDAPWPSAASVSCQPTECTNVPSAPTHGAVSFSAGNAHGSVASFSCNTGYSLTSGSAAVTCSAPSTDTPWPVSGATCTDTDGCVGHRCDDEDADANCDDVAAPGAGYTCSCTTGYEFFGGTCRDVDACDGHTCADTDSGATCTDQPPPSVGYVCACSAGFTFDGISTCEPCSPGTYKPAFGGGSCAPCHQHATSPAGATTPGACQCNFGYYGNGFDDCQVCGPAANCQVSGDGCVGDVLRCTTAEPGFYVDSQGAVQACSAGCTTCSDGTSCDSCDNDNASAAPGNLCTCNEGFYGDGTVCVETNPCEDVDCGSNGDSGATCRVLTFDSYECECSEGYEAAEGTCVDVNGCVGNTCASLGDDGAVCNDLPAPSLSYACACSAAFVATSEGCAACPENCLSCSSTDSCDTCIDDATATDDGSCACNAGFYFDGSQCLNCRLAIDGCRMCESASVCVECSLGTLAADGSACEVSGSTGGASGSGDSGEVGGVVESDATTDDTDSGSSAGMVVGVFSGISVLCCIIAVLAVLAMSRQKKKNQQFKFATNGDADSTVQISGGQFGDYLKGQLAKTKPFASGGFGAVYKIPLESGKVVALKVLDPHATEVAKAEFHRECNVLTKLTTLNSNLIVAMACFCEDPVCLGMEYASKGTLMDRLKAIKLTDTLLFETALEAAKPLDFLHKAKFAHLDVKPQNFLVMEDERVVLCDFGLTIEISEPVTNLSGTPQYLAPERYVAATSVTASVTNMSEVPVITDPRACDVFSFGIMMSAFANGEMPFAMFEASNVASMIAERDMRPGMPETAAEWYKNLATRCWSKSPADRPTMAEVVNCIDVALNPDCTVAYSAPSGLATGSVTSLHDGRMAPASSAPSLDLASTEGSFVRPPPALPSIDRE